MSNEHMWDDTVAKPRKLATIPKLVITGDPCEGFTFYGPFDNVPDAHDFAESLTSDWWTANLYAPEDA